MIRKHETNEEVKTLQKNDNVRRVIGKIRAQMKNTFTLNKFHLYVSMY